MLAITLAAVAAAYWTGYEAHRARREAADAAKESLTTQLQSVDAQIQSMQIEQRPYVNVTFKGMSKDPVSGVFLRVVAVVSGHTPATHVRIRTYCEKGEVTDFGNVPDPEKPSVGESETVRDSIYSSVDDRNYMSPGQPMQDSCLIDPKMLASPGPLKVVGVVYYSDLFNRLHRTPFCFASYVRPNFGTCLPAAAKNMPPID
jgi:hypothetical protein